MITIRPSNINEPFMKKYIRPALIPALLAAAFPACADTEAAGTADGEHYTATLPTVTVVG